MPIAVKTFSEKMKKRGLEIGASMRDDKPWKVYVYLLVSPFGLAFMLLLTVLDSSAARIMWCALSILALYGTWGAFWIHRGYRKPSAHYDTKSMPAKQNQASFLFRYMLPLAVFSTGLAALVRNLFSD